MHLPTVAFQPGLSKVQQIVDALSQAIDQGLLNPGSKLPSAREMTAHWGVSKFTLIEALDRLRGQDRITSSQGLGYFVATKTLQSGRATALDLLPQDLHSVLRRSRPVPAVPCAPAAGIYRKAGWKPAPCVATCASSVARQPCD